MRIARVGRRGTRIILGWLLAACLALGAVHGGAAEQRYVYDELGRLIAVIDPAGETTHYTYDEAGNLTAVSRASSAQVSIVAFTPARARTGTAVTIFGTGFSATPAQNAVTFNGTPASVTSSTTTSIVAVVPVAAASGPIRVTTPTGSATSAQAFVVVVPQPPAIAAFAPALVAPNGTIVISGSAFQPIAAENQVRVNISNAAIIAATEESLTVRAPNATGGKVSVTTSDGSAISVDDVFVVPPPNVVADVVATRRLTIDGPGAALTLPASRIGLALFDGIAGQVGIKVSVRDVSLFNGTLTVFAPNGSTLASTSFGNGGATLSLPALPASGSYGVRVAGTGTAGNATVAVWRDVTGTLAVDVPVDVTFTNPGQQARFTFTSAGGEFFGLDFAAIALSGNTGVMVLRPDGSAVINTSIGVSGAGFRVPDGGPGVYTVIITPASNGTGSLRLTLWRDVSGALAVGTPVNVAIGFRNQWARYTFVAAQGDFFGLDISNVNLGGNTGFMVLRPDGTAVINTSVGVGGAGFRVPHGGAGTYTVILMPPSGGTGSAQLRLWRDVTAELALDAPLDVGLPFRNQQARLTFLAGAGDFLGLDLTNVDLGGNFGIQVLRPDGVAVINTSVGVGGAGFRVPQAGAGLYTVIIQPPGTGSVRVTLWRDVGGALALDTPVNAQIAFRNQWARYTFTAAANDFLGVDIANVNLGGNTGIMVLRPDGAAVINTSVGVNGAGFRVPQGAGGEYTLVIMPPSGGVGSVRVTLWRDITDVLQLDAGYPLTIAFRNQQARFTFAANTSDAYGVDISNVTFPSNSNGIMVLRPSDGAAIINTSFPTGAGASFRVPQGGAGTYTVVIAPGSGEVGQARVTLWRDHPGTFELGTPVNLNIAYRNQGVRMSYPASANQFLGVDVANVAFGGGIQVLRPDGAAVVNTSFPSGGAGFRIPQTSAGTYTVVITPNSGATGAIRLTLWEDVPGTLAIGPQIDVAVPFRNQWVRKTFVAAAGQNLGVDLSDFVGFTGGGIQVLRPDGAAIVNTTFSGVNGGSFRIPTTGAGLHTVIISPNSAGTGSFKLRLWSDVTDELTIGATYALNIPIRNQQGRLPFTSSGGETLTVELSAIAFPSGGGILVLRPDGVAVVNTTYGTAGFSTTLNGTQAGTYTVNIVPNSSGTGTMNVRVFRP